MATNDLPSFNKQRLRTLKVREPTTALRHRSVTLKRHAGDEQTNNAKLKKALVHARKNSIQYMTALTRYS
jgi:hypothetical protein